MIATLIIKDEVNLKITGLDLETRKYLNKKFKFYLPHARYTAGYKLGRWDGSITYFQLGGSTYLSLLDEILPILFERGYDIEIDDRRTYLKDFSFEKITDTFLADQGICWPAGHVHENEPIVFKDHQTNAINTFLENTQSIQELSTASGKTIITATLSMIVEQYGRSIIVVPNRSLVTQTEEDYVNIGLDVGVIFGGRHEYDKTHTICTWQSLSSIIRTSKKDPSAIKIEDILEGVVAVIVDECHQMKADELRKMLHGPMAAIPIRWGVTGTVPKEDYNFYALKTSIGEVVGKVQAADLQEKGILANCNINILQLKDWGDYKTYQSEMSYLTGDKDRLEQIADMINTIKESGNTLVLVNYVKTGKILNELIDDSVFLSGKDKNEARKKEYDSIKNAQNKTIIATYGIAAVGISINRIYNLVLIEPGKSFVRVIQSIGRGLRVAKDKNHVEIWDITSTCKFAKRHLAQRKKYYKEAKYPFSITKIDRL